MSLTIAQLLFICLPISLGTCFAYWLGMVQAEKRLHDQSKYIAIGIYDELKALSNRGFDSEFLIQCIAKKIKDINLTK